MAQIGATIEQMHDLSRAFTTEADTVQQLVSHITGQIGSTWWVGPAADNFKRDWESDFKPALTRLQASLEHCATEVSNRANAIEQAGT